MLRWADHHLLDRKWEEIGEHYEGYRLHVPGADRTMARSLERYGQLPHVVVCRRQDCYELIDGFKRLGAVRSLAQIRVCRPPDGGDERTAKAADLRAESCRGRTRELEEALDHPDTGSGRRMSQVELPE